MKCPKCGYISFDHHSACPRCRRDLKAERSRLNLPAFMPEPPSFLHSAGGGDEPSPAPRPDADYVIEMDSGPDVRDPAPPPPPQPPAGEKDFDPEEDFAAPGRDLLESDAEPAPMKAYSEGRDSFKKPAREDSPFSVDLAALGFDLDEGDKEEK